MPTWGPCKQGALWCRDGEGLEAWALVASSLERTRDSPRLSACAGAVVRGEGQCVPVYLANPEGDAFGLTALVGARRNEGS